MLGALAAAILFASYQSYIARQAADAQAAQVKKAYREQQGKEAERIQENARAFQSSIKGTDSPAEAPPLDRPGRR